MSNLVIVAVPNESDYVWRLSSEKVPHMTILFLGDSNNENRDRIGEFLEHAAATTLNRFGLSVDRRGVLGEDEADVLFFDDNYGFIDSLRDFRSLLLKDDDIFEAFSSVQQYPEWKPHLTLGYPNSPAKPDSREYPGINWVNFDRIELWYDDYAGLVIPLSDNNMAVEMSDLERATEGEKALDALLHYGVKGMKWGVRQAYATRRTGEAEKMRKIARGETSVLTRVNTLGPWALTSNKSIAKEADRIEAHAKRVAAGKIATSDILAMTGKVYITDVVKGARIAKGKGRA